MLYRIDEFILRLASRHHAARQLDICRCICRPVLHEWLPASLEHLSPKEDCGICLDFLEEKMGWLMGIEPTFSVPQTVVLPLDDSHTLGVSSLSAKRDSILVHYGVAPLHRPPADHDPSMLRTRGSGRLMQPPGMMPQACTWLSRETWSPTKDLNLRHPRPKRGALARLS